MLGPIGVMFFQTSWLGISILLSSRAAGTGGICAILVDPVEACAPESLRPFPQGRMTESPSVESPAKMVANLSSFIHRTYTLTPD